LAVSDDGKGIVSHAGAVLLTETARVTGLAVGLSQVLERWQLPRELHDPGKIVADLAIAVALGGDCLADAGVLRAEPALFGPVASDPVISRLISRLAADAPAALKAIGKARAAARERAWQLAGPSAPSADDGLITADTDATLVTAHSDKEQAAAAWKKGWGFHPLTVFADHGAGGSGEPLAIMLRPGNAGSNTAADHITATRLALAQVPPELRRRVLVRADSGKCRAPGGGPARSRLPAPSSRHGHRVFRGRIRRGAGPNCQGGSRTCARQAGLKSEHWPLSLRARGGGHLPARACRSQPPRRSRAGA
jgi:Transposase DDE domain group 1